MDEKELFAFVRDFVTQVNTVNKRMVVAIIAVVACLCVFMSIAVVTYFTADYDYGVVSQYQTGGSGQSQTIMNGGETNG